VSSTKNEKPKCQDHSNTNVPLMMVHTV